MSTFTDLANSIMKPKEIPETFTRSDLDNNVALVCKLRSDYIAITLLDIAVELLKIKDKITVKEIKDIMSNIDLEDVVTQEVYNNY